MKPLAQINSYKNEVEQQAAAILFKLLVSIGIAYLFVVLIGIFYGDVVLIATMLVGLITLILPYIFLRRGQVSAASISLALIVIGTLTASATTGQGINDLAIIAFPIIYYFTSVSLNRTVLKISFGITLLAIFWLTFGDLNGWYVPQPVILTGWGAFLIVAVILGAAAFTSDLLATSLQKNLERAEREIDQRTITEQALRESEARYRELVDNSPTGILAIDTQGQIISVNRRILEILGSPSVEATMDINLFTFEPLEKAGISAAFKQVIDTGELLKAEHAYQSKWGKQIQVYAIYTPTKNAQGTVIGVQANVEDITERKQIEGALKESEEKFKQLVKNSFDMIVLIDSQGIQHYVSESCENILGYKPEELMDIAVIDKMIHPDDREKTMLGVQNILSGGSGNVQYRHKHKNGGWIHLEAIGTNQLDNPAIKMVVLNVRDITQRKALEHKLRQAHKMEAVGTMVGGIAHEFNNILQGIFLYGDILENQLPDEKSRKSLQAMMTGAKRASQIVSQIRAFSSQSNIRIEPLDLKPLLLETIKTQRQVMPAGIEFVEKINPDCGMIQCDVLQIQAIITNLCNNAQDAMPEGGTLTFSLNETSSSELSGNDDAEAQILLKLEISDTGVGMDEETLEKAFDPFFTTKGVNEGTGLGLSVVHGLIGQMGGNITAASTVGKGSSFRILLPVIDETAASGTSKTQ